MNLALLLVCGCVALGVGGLGFVLLGGDSLTEKRRSALQSSQAKAIATSGGADRNQRKKQIAEGLKELERKGTDRKRTVEGMIEQAGLSITKSQFFIYSAGLGFALAALNYVRFGNAILALMSLLVGSLGIPRFLLKRLAKRRMAKFVDGLANAIDIIVRGVKSGLPLGDTIRIVANEANEPVKSEFRRVVESQAIGLALPEAVERMAERVPLTETNFFSIVIAIQSKAGGNLAEALANLSKVLRERKKMKGKIGAMSMEAKASAAIIGAVPFFVVGALYMAAPAYITLLWTTSVGRMTSLAALVWMGIGAAIMKKMINFDF